MRDGPGAAGTGALAVEHAARLLQRDPALALEQCTEILKAAPNHPVARLMQGIAHRLSGDAATAVKVLTRLTDAQHRWAQAHHERGLALMDTGHLSEAIAAIRCAIDLKPDLPDAHRTLGDLLTAAGDSDAADHAYAVHIKVSTRDPRLLAPANALVENRIPEAEGLLRAHLKAYPSDVVALRMLAEVAARLGRLEDSSILLERCLEVAPGFHAARYNHALVLHRRDRPAEALKQIDQLLEVDPRHLAYRNLKAVVLVKIGEYREAVSLYSQILAGSPGHPAIWMSLAHALSTEGRVKEAIAAYRRSIDLQPGFGEAYWSLANLKTFRFDASEVDAMRVQLARADLGHEDRFHFHFALGKAQEDAGEYAESFEHYAQGNSLRRQRIRYDAADTSARLERTRQVLTQAKALGFPLKIHADEFDNLGGASLAVEMGAVSADHLVKTSDADITALGCSETVAVSLPCTPFGLGELEYSPAHRLLDAGCARARAPDCSPGPAWNESMQFVIALACRAMKLTPAQAIVASTINAAQAIRMADKVGSLEPGKQADLLVLSVPDYRHLGYRFGTNLVRQVIKKGRVYSVDVGYYRTA